MKIKAIKDNKGFLRCPVNTKHRQFLNGYCVQCSPKGLQVIKVQS